MTPPQRSTFLPLTVAAAADTGDGVSARAVQHRVREADTAAVDYWTTLLAGCASPTHLALPARLNALVPAVVDHVGAYRFGPGTSQRRRVVEARFRIDEAVADADGAEFAAAFAGYDQAVATAVASAQSSGGSVGNSDKCDPTDGLGSSTA